MNPNDFWYLKLKQWGDRGTKKEPAEAFGGFDTDFEDNDNIYTYEQTQELDHWNWGVCGYRGDNQLVVVDFDAHQVPDFDSKKVARPTTGISIIKSINEDREIPGFHFYCLVDDPDIDFSAGKDFVDVKANGKGLVVSPYHRDSYELVHDDELQTFIDTGIVDAFQYDDENLITSQQSYAGGDIEDIDIPDEPPEEIPLCLEKALNARASIPRDGSFDGNPWQVDSVVGRRLVAFGYSKGEALSLLEKYDPRDDYDPKESSYQLDKLYQKELHPDSPQSLVDKNVIDEPECDCRFCSPSSTQIIADDPKHFTDFEVDSKEHVIMQSIARTGKSHTLIGESCKLRDDEKIVYLSGSHSEARASVKKYRKHGYQVCYLVGKARAKDKYDVSTEGAFDPSYVAMDPKDASLRDDINAYNGLIQGAKQADIVVTVPELVHKIGDFDWLIMTEEAAFDRMLSSEIKVIDVERFRGYDRSVSGTMHSHQPQAQAIIDYIDDLETTTAMHNWIRTSAQVIVDICSLLEDWSAADWHEVENTWDHLVEDVESRLNDIAFEEEADLHEARTWLMNHFNRAASPILNVMFADGVFTYDNGNRKQLFIVGDTDRCFIELPDDLTVWTAGNNIPAMEEFHNIVHGESPTVKPFYGGYTPVQDSIVVLKHDGGRNPNEQSSQVQRVIEEVQSLEQNVGNLLISGSSHHSAQHAQRIKKCTTPGAMDDLEALRDYSENGMTVAAAENMWCVEGIDTPFFEMGALYRGEFATPREDYIAEKTGDDSLSRAEHIRAAQNAVLRPSDVPDEGTGTTPVIVPTMHVPDEIFEMFEQYGITVMETEGITDIRRLIIKLLDLEADEHDNRIVDPSEAPETIKPFDELFGETAG